jgi:putative SOS response-associated peptidase YedK
MCNDYRRTPPMQTIREQWSQTMIPLRFPEGLPNLAPLESIRITDRSAIIRAAAPQRSEAGAAAPPEQRSESLQAGRPAALSTGPTGSGRPDPFEADLVVRRWSWPGPGGKPVYNYRSDGREFTRGRCLIVADGFYEFTAPADPKQKRKDKWLFTRPGEEMILIAGLWRATPDVGEAFTMLTTEPGPDVAPYHNRQVVVVDRTDWGRWLDPSVPAREICKPLPAGSLAVAKVS